MEAPIIQTCRAAGLLIAAVAVIAAAPAPVPDVAALYVRGRAAQASGDAAGAAAAFGRAFAAEPDDAGLGAQALRTAIGAGDWKAAEAAAKRLDAAGASPVEALLWRLSDAVRRKDWRGARGAADRLEATGAFGFAVPVVRAWTAYGARERDPLGPLAGAADAAGQAYAAEHRALLLLALKKRAEGAAAISATASTSGGRGLRLKLAGAARLAELDDRAAAAALLAGEEEPLRAGRALLASKRRLPGAVEGAGDGIAELFARAAVDLQRERVTPLAVTLARLATYLAPGNSETWLVTAELLAADAQTAPAIAALARVEADDPFAGIARAMRAQLLVRSGDTATALSEARAAAGAPGSGTVEIVRYADLLGQAERHAEAVPLYARAIAMREAGALGADLWLLHLLHGSALTEAGRWPEAKAALESARRIAPAEPQVLNFLGYAQLERRENLDAAEALIREASRLQPDDPSITDSLGWALYHRGKVAEAIPVLERAVAADPRQAEIGEHLGDAYWTAGRRVDARYAWSAALLNADVAEAARMRVKLDTGMTPAVAAP